MAGGVMSATAAGSLVDEGRWLVEHRFEMDRGESAWLGALARFDRSQGWAVDGQLSCVDWLCWRARMARATAYEKLQVAHELSRRPLMAQAFGEARVSYSVVRAMSRMEHPDPEVDAALIELGRAGTVADVERMVRHYNLHRDQERPPADPSLRRGLRVRRGPEGMATVEITLTEVEIEEVVAALRLALDSATAADRSAAAESTGGPVDESAAAERETAPAVAPIDALPYPARRADAFMDLLRAGAAHLGEGPAPGADRYLVHLVREAGQPVRLVDGAPLPPSTAATVECDCSTVEHEVSGGAPLRLGRRTRQWSTAQRRAILVRDRGRCRFPGCTRRVADVHHIRWWERGGPTDVSNGMLVCPRHHTMLHSGYDAEGDADGPVRFLRPGGTEVGTG